ncbi:symmetrical bis(5'-nucleosyl)-tetraphosphatase [Pusillimonas caeni]|uniref:symmetrical bis(5'-nucleosyl)-tetraphosphatase n=1 Tax=Pusillimonas caeni TaxID=1348472 RepID=UPI000E59D81C|nr:symmetrical bis(5'-nucleosyl)-tetraphosphatase [Pusillimonas caeni]TFL13379.1 symmetrical bis(5'-nucleosyl)-tetraphosphatase [Pusillimonas caeni]
MSASDIWMVGDLQGCCRSLEALLDHPDIAAGDEPRFWFAGDLINRGPASLQTLRRVMAMGDRAISVLGNHDLHLLGIAAGVRKPGKSDTFDEILDAPDAEDLLDWIRHRPLAHHEHGHLLVHAGVLPQWRVADVARLAAEVQRDLRAPDWRERLQTMYGNEPSQWRDDLEGDERRRIVINALTRLRMCDAQGRMEFRHKLAPTKQDWEISGLLPWYDAPERRTRDEATIVFGHWSTLGLLMRPDVICLDTGCVWGRRLTAVRLADRKVIQIDCGNHADAS